MGHDSTWRASQSVCDAGRCIRTAKSREPGMAGVAILRLVGLAHCTLFSLFDSAHQHRVLTVVCAIECRQQLPAFRREPRNLSVSDVAKHFRGSEGSIGVLGAGAALR